MDVADSLVLAYLFFIGGIAFGAWLNEPYRSVDQCQHDGMSRTQCWCLEKRGWDAKAMRECVLEAPDGE